MKFCRDGFYEIYSCRSIRIQTINSSLNLLNMSARFSLNFVFTVWWKTSSSPTFCIFTAINLAHICTGIINVVHFKRLNSPKSSCLAGEAFRCIWFIDKETKLCFFFLRKLDFLFELHVDYHSKCEKYPPFSWCFRAHRACAPSSLQVWREFVMSQCHTHGFRCEMRLR